MIKKTSAIAALLAVVAQVAVAQTDERVASIQKRLQDAAQKTTDAFVFLGGGSGVIISADGWFLTNHHVIAAAGGKVPDKTRINLSDGRQFQAKMVCTDAVGDIALLKIDGDHKDFVFIEIGDSDRVEVGQYCVAVGNPFSLAMATQNKRIYPSVSFGIVSAVHRFQQQYSDCIQTDAAVNPGNSGGPLVDINAKLIGINGRIATRYNNRVNSGVGYAISANQIKNFLPEMMKGGIDGKIYHAQVKGLEVNPSHNDGLGAVVTGVRQSSTAARAGFKEGDVIVGVNEYTIATAVRFYGVIGTYPMEREVEIKVKREGETVALKARLDRSDNLDILGKPPKLGGAYLGVILEDKEGGAEVTFVAEGSPAEKSGLEVGDLIQKIDGTKVTTRDTILERVRLRKPGDVVALSIRRGSETLELSATLGKRDD